MKVLSWTVQWPKFSWQPPLVNNHSKPPRKKKTHGPKCKTQSRLARLFDRVLLTSIYRGLREIRVLGEPYRWERPVFLRPPRSPLPERRLKNGQEGLSPKRLSCSIPSHPTPKRNYRCSWAKGKTPSRLARSFDRVLPTSS